VAIVLGLYGRNHQPTGEAIFTLGFSGMINMKVWLATIAVPFALFQLASALRLYGSTGLAGRPAG
jgi:Na+(H+)/acetate symporter ActP